MIKIPARASSVALQLLVQKLGLASKEVIDALLSRDRNLMLLALLGKYTESDESHILQLVGNAVNAQVIEIDPQSLVDSLRAMDIPGFDIQDALAKRYLPVRREAGRMVVAFADPFDLDTARFLAFTFGEQIKIALAKEAVIVETLGIFSKKNSSEQDPVRNKPVEKENLREGDESSSEIANSEAMTRFIKGLFYKAISQNASHVLFEPLGKELVIFFRRDGVNTRYVSVPLKLHKFVVQRVLLMAGLAIPEIDQSREGKFSIAPSGGPQVDVIVTASRTSDGPRMSLRFLRTSKEAPSLAALGLDEETARRWRELIGQGGQMSVLIGPADSGRRSAYYASLAELAGRGLKVLDINSCVECEISGVSHFVVQGHIEQEVSKAIAVALEPDYQVIGIADKTVKQSSQLIEAALNMGKFLLVLCEEEDPVLFSVVEWPLEKKQRLSSILILRQLRRLCPACAKPVSDNSRIELELKYGLDFTKAKEASGCNKCEFTGYLGRQKIYSLEDASCYHNWLDLDRLPFSSLGENRLAHQGLAEVVSGNSSIEELENVLGRDTLERYRVQLVENDGDINHTGFPGIPTLDQLKASFLSLPQS